MKRLLALMLSAASLFSAAGQVPDYVPTEGLVGWYPLDGDAQEASNDSLDGNFSASYGLAEGNRFGQQGGALGFLRQEQTQVVLPPLLDFGDSTFTLSGWFKSTALEPSQAIINSIPRNILALGYNHGENLNAQHVSLWLDDDDSGWDISFNGHSEQEFALEIWHHVVVIRSGDAISLFVNGELDWSLSLDENIGSPSEGLVLGSINGAEFFNGCLDDFGFWQRALTDEEVLELFNAPATLFGCTDTLACNYIETANVDDGTCASCEQLQTACGEGTIWDESSHTCVVANVSDTDFDGCVGINDFLVHLSNFGLGCGPALACGDPVSYQGYDYETVQIGEQCWFAENLRAENYRNGDAIPASLSDAEWAGTAEGAVSVYDEDMSNLDTYGRLYNWYAVDDPRALCPLNWKIATNEEWSVVVESVASDQDLISQDWVDVGTNTSGFSLLPGGKRDYVGAFALRSDFGYYWTSTEADNNSSFHVLVGTGGLSEGNNLQSDGMSIRCIKDTE